MKRKTSKGLALLTASAVAAVTVLGTGTPAAQAAEAEYEIYPKPHEISYEGDSWILKNEVNVVYEDGIDEATQDRLDEVFALKDGITVSESDEIVEGKTNVLVGIDGSDGYVDQYAEENVEVSADGLFDKLDSYVLDSKEDVITVLGADTDASFYGLTTLYHIVKQMDSQTIRSFHIEDWADVASRGFIEGYYGNPWSTQDRINLMKWGGYYKLNSYFYAPKNDPKHNAQWRTLYTDEEIETLIKPLADAGNESKCRFVFALHTFMNNPVRFDTEEHYQEDLAIVQAKFEQVIEAGVRQVAILADDAANAGADNYIRFLNDMTEWLAEMGEKYPDLKQTLPFCTVEYMYNGQSYYQQFPENVQIVMTGGKIWGEVSNSFTETFTNTAGRGPYMWINWPCTDNSKNHLIMGGYSTFLHPGVDPSKIQGIVLNPMQQSEPSKVAIFGNACYSWNIWETEDEADQAWNDSFKYVDHNSAVENEASAALRELSKHMMNQNMDSRVTALQESVDLAPLLTDFRDKLNANTVTAEEADALIAEFEILQEAADTYEAQAGDTNVRDQIVQFLNCWDDTTDAAIAYLNGVKAVLANDTTALLQYNTEGKAAFDSSKTHAIWYLDHNEYAEVGVQHIVPFINAVAEYVSKYAETAMNPDAVIQSFITNRTDSPTGSTDNVFDGDDGTMASYRNPVWIHTGDYVGVLYNRTIDITDIRFLLGNGKNHFEASKLQYTADGKEWKDLELTGMENAFTGVQGEYLEINVAAENLPEDFQAMGIRLTATADNKLDAYLNVHEIQINKNSAQTPGGDSIQYNVMRTERWKVYQGSEANLYDGNDDTFVWYDPDGDANTTGDDFMAGDYLGYDLGKVADLVSAHIVVGHDGGDKLINYTIETSVDNVTWTPVKGYENYTGADSGKDTLDIDLSGTSARYIRIRNLTQQGSWGKFSEFTVKEKIGASSEYVYTNISTDITSTADEGIVSLSSGKVMLNEDEYIGVKLSNIKAVTGVAVSELPKNAVLETSMNGITWTPYQSDETVDARYIRIRSTAAGTELNLTQFDVNFEFIGDYAVESDFATAQTSNDMRTSGTVGNVFDGDLTTIGMINGAQEAGKHITFDLGQVIHFSSLRYYIIETQLNYLRNADFEVSADGEKWTKVLHVGQETENVWDDTTAKDMQGITLTHDDMNPGYMYAEATDLDVDGRYIRVTPVETYSHRWVGFSEIQINGGAYISTEANRDVIAEDIEEEGKIPSNMLDGDYTTTYKSSAEDSSFTYRLSEPEGVASIRLIQTGTASGAEVTAKYIGEENSVSLGKLNQPINEFLIPEGKTLESITVTWTDKIPEIAEIAASTDRGTAVDKDALEEALEQTAEDAWTTDSKEAYQAAWDVANEIFNNENASQTIVDSALGSLQAAYNNAEMKASNAAELQEMVDGRISNEKIIYTSSTYSAYENAVNRLAAALENADNLSQEKADSLKADVETAQAALMYSTANREQAELETLRYDAVNGENYTTDSYAALTAAKEAIDALAAQDKAAESGEGERVYPERFIEAKDAFSHAMDSLIDVTELKAAIALEDQVTDPSIYTEESYAAFADAVENGKMLLKNGTKDAVADAVEQIKDAYAALDLKPETTLDEVIAEAKAVLNAEGAADKYTEDSYQTLADIVEEAEANTDDTKDAEYAAAIQSAMDGLVDVTALRAQISAAQAVDAKLYTSSSYKALTDLLGQTDAEDLLKSGSREEVSAAAAVIENAIRALVPRAQGAEDYRDSITLKPEKGYTADSYKAYKEAYEALMNADPSDLSAAEFAQLKAAFEKAEQNLKPVDSAQGGGQDNGQDSGKTDTAVATGDDMNVLPIVIVLILCVAAAAAVIIIRKKRK